ncbi:MAG: CRISPR-associated primase-polymerase type A1 [Gemmataceae bacterium]|nr:CRISPR-associated primase-polymerase type A1 [Gemmataceae bacterium]MDW8265894.1 CRISPR-associated primase-polymerase type A1 [Gemmataceae bacterium]
MSDLASFRDRLRSGDDPTVLADLEAAVLARREVRGGHTEWGLLCEEAGLMPLAFREFQLALRDNPDDDVAAHRLARHYWERGDTGRAAGLLERLLNRQPANAEWLTLYAEVLREDDAGPRLQAALQRAVEAGLAPELAKTLARHEATDDDQPPEVELAPSDADCARFLTLFAGREDVHARQWSSPKGEGGYSPVHEPLTVAVVRNHLLGTYTVGVYPIRLDGTCTFFVIDLDIDKGALEQALRQPSIARSLRDALRRHALQLLGLLRDIGFELIFEDSGYKGRHFWVFLEQPESADVLHRFGRQFLAWHTPQLPPGLRLEFFPKQGSRSGKGLGNLIKLPLGIHRRTGRRAALLDDQGQPLSQPLAALRRVVRCPRAVLYAAIDRLKAVPTDLASAEAPLPPGQSPPPPVGPPPPPPAPPWTEADFTADPRIRHLLHHCPVLAELKQTVDEHRRLSHEEQLVLIHTLGHVEGGPQAVNYLLGKCVDVGPEKLLKSQLRGNPVSCASIRKKVGHITRRVPCNCSFDYAPDRYPTPLLHLLTLPPGPPAPPSPAPDLETLARRFAASATKLAEVQREHDSLRQAFVTLLRLHPDREVACPGGRYRLVEDQGVEELQWVPETTSATPHQREAQPPSPGDEAGRPPSQQVSHPEKEPSANNFVTPVGGVTSQQVSHPEKEPG